MNKTQLKKEVGLQLNGYARPWIDLIVNLTIEVMISKLENKEEIRIKGLGVLFTKKARGWKIRNPINGKWTEVPNRIKVRFRPSKKLEKKINGR